MVPSFWTEASGFFQKASHMLQPLQRLSTVSTGQSPGKLRKGIGLEYSSSIVKDPLVDCSSFLCKICFQVGSLQD